MSTSFDPKIWKAALPKLVNQIVHTQECWIVGSAATGKHVHDPSTDIDIMVPLASWPAVAAMLMAARIAVTPTSFGGWRFTAQGRSVDIWPDSLERIFNTTHSPAAWCVRTGVRIVRETT